jgi:hypothetical protein
MAGDLFDEARRDIVEMAAVVGEHRQNFLRAYV